MKNYIVLFLTTICITLCFETTKSQNLNAKIKSQETIKTQVIVQKILDIPEIQWIYHPEIKNRIPVKLLETKKINKNIQLIKFNKKIIIISTTNENTCKDCLKINYRTINKNTISVKMAYPIEGVTLSGKLLRVNKEWKLFFLSITERKQK